VVVAVSTVDADGRLGADQGTHGVPFDLERPLPTRWQSGCGRDKHRGYHAEILPSGRQCRHVAMCSLTAASSSAPLLAPTWTSRSSAQPNTALPVFLILASRSPAGQGRHVTTASRSAGQLPYSVIDCLLRGGVRGHRRSPARWCRLQAQRRRRQVSANRVGSRLIAGCGR